jgi:hypothetical protein
MVQISYTTHNEERHVVEHPAENKCFTDVVELIPFRWN